MHKKESGEEGDNERAEAFLHKAEMRENETVGFLIYCLPLEGHGCQLLDL
jgi:hypothetical protein